MSDLAPFTGFGDDPNTAVKFSIAFPDGGLPQPQGGPRVNVLDIAMGGSVVQRNGRDPYTWTWTLWFETLADLELLDALQGQMATLRYLHGLTLRMDGTHTIIAGVEYLELPNTILLNLVPSLDTGGQYEATATFFRDVSGGEYYGFARYS